MPKHRCAGCGCLKKGKQFDQVKGKSHTHCKECCSNPIDYKDQLVVLRKKYKELLKNEPFRPEYQDPGDVHSDLRSLREWVELHSFENDDPWVAFKKVLNEGLASDRDWEKQILSDYLRIYDLRSKWWELFQTYDLGTSLRVEDQRLLAVDHSTFPKLPSLFRLYDHYLDFAVWHHRTEKWEKEKSKLEAQLAVLERSVEDESVHEKARSAAAEMVAARKQREKEELQKHVEKCTERSREAKQARADYLDHLRAEAKKGPVDFAYQIEIVRGQLLLRRNLRESAEREVRALCEGAEIDPLNPTPENAKKFGQTNCESLTNMAKRFTTFQRIHVGGCCDLCSDPSTWSQWKGKRLFEDIPNFLEHLENKPNEGPLPEENA